MATFFAYVQIGFGVGYFMFVDGVGGIGDIIWALILIAGIN